MLTAGALPSFSAFSCTIGHILSPSTSSTAECLATGQWSIAIPSCVPRSCQPLSHPSFGSVAYSDPNLKYPTTATYACDDGYELHGGDAERACSPDTGTFDGTAPECRGVLCASIAAPAFGSVSTSAARYPATATFSCSAGYEVAGDETVACGTDGQWAEHNVLCQGVLCAAPTVNNGDVTTSSPRYPSTATVECSPGYGMQGTASAACTTDGEWGALPECKRCASREYAPTGTSSCVECSDCPDGLVRVDCGGRSQGSCEPCPDG